jgi:hypothetical protein
VAGAVVRRRESVREVVVGMSAFKVGDVCVIVGLLPIDRKYEGMECEIVSRGCCLDREMEGGPLAWYLTHIRDKKGSDYIHHSNLRLKRPPSWDKWIYETSDVDGEQAVVA